MLTPRTSFCPLPIDLTWLAPFLKAEGEQTAPYPVAERAHVCYCDSNLVWQWGSTHRLHYHHLLRHSVSALDHEKNSFWWTDGHVKQATVKEKKYLITVRCGYLFLQIIPQHSTSSSCRKSSWALPALLLGEKWGRVILECLMYFFVFQILPQNRSY